MCGFAGFLGGSRDFSQQEAEKIIEKMNMEILSRGPDDSGQWFNSEENIGMGHRRLSIIDLSSAGHQPMKSYQDYHSTNSLKFSPMFYGFHSIKRLKF